MSSYVFELVAERAVLYIVLVVADRHLLACLWADLQPLWDAQLMHNLCIDLVVMYIAIWMRLVCAFRT